MWVVCGRYGIVLVFCVVSVDCVSGGLMASPLMVVVIFVLNAEASSDISTLPRHYSFLFTVAACFYHGVLSCSVLVACGSFCVVVLFHSLFGLWLVYCECMFADI